jgi:arylsulfatase
MNRRYFLKCAGIGAAVLAVPGMFSIGAAQAAGESAKKPNILLFFPDQHRYDWTSMNPVMPDITPNLKQLASEGAHFSLAFCPSPLCAPSRACLTLGKEYAGCGVGGNGGSLSLEATTFYKLLRDSAGYHVLGCGKFDLDKPGESWGLDGKHKREGKPSLLEMWGFSDGIDNAGKGDGRGTKQPEPYNAYRRSEKGSAATPDEKYCDNWIARNGLELIRSVPTGKPWFLQINFNGPHDPFDPTDTMVSKWEQAKFPPAVPVDKKSNDRIKYAAEIFNIDNWIAVYKKELKKRGELENTIIAYSSDHGEMLHDHGYQKKSRPLSPSACVPLVIAGPGIKPGLNYKGAAETLDLAATFLDYAGVPVPKDMDSKSMRPYLEGRGDYPRKYVTSALQRWALVCDGRYKLIKGDLGGMVDSKDEDKSMVLYDLQNDPNEMVDLAAKHPEIVAELMPRLPSLGEGRDMRKEAKKSKKKNKEGGRNER